MKKIYALFVVIALACTLSSCYRSRCEVWEDTKTCGRYVGKGFRSFFGQHADSGDYERYYSQWEEGELVRADDYEPLVDAQAQPNFTLRDYPISMESPGDHGSNIPGIERFVEPSGELASLFAKIHFETDQYGVKGNENIATLRSIANHLAKHPKTYVFITGHADERGAAAYNLSLGSKRANAVRNFLIDNGVHPDHLFTISYGLERPVALGHDEKAWAQNRRTEFKLYDR